MVFIQQLRNLAANVFLLLKLTVNSVKLIDSIFTSIRQATSVKLIQNLCPLMNYFVRDSLVSPFRKLEVRWVGVMRCGALFFGI